MAFYREFGKTHAAVELSVVEEAEDYIESADVGFSAVFVINQRAVVIIGAAVNSDYVSVCVMNVALTLFYK